MNSSSFSSISTSTSSTSTSAHAPSVGLVERAFAHRWPLLLAVALVALYLSSWSSRWYLSPDSAVYMMLGDSLASSHDYLVSGVPHAKYPPGFPLLIAGMQQIGLGQVASLNAIMLALGLAVLYATYRLLAGKGPLWLVLAVVCCLGMNFEMYRTSRMLLSDVPFMLMVLAGVICLERGVTGQQRWLALGCALLFAATWVRLPGIPLALGAALAIAIKSREVAPRKQFTTWAVALAVASLSTAAIWGWRSTVLSTENAGKSYAAEMSQLSGRGLLDWAFDPLINFYQSGEEISRLLTAQTMPNWLAWLLLGTPIVIGLVQSIRRGDMLWACIVAGYLGGILVVRTPIVRYLLPIAPFLLWYYLSGSERIFHWAKARRVPVATWLLALLLIGFNLPKDLYLACGIHRTDFASVRAEWPPVLESAELLETEAGLNDRFLAPAGDGEMMAYLTGVPFWQIGRTLSKSPPAGEAMGQMLDAEGITLVVVYRAKQREGKLFYSSLSQYVSESADFECACEGAYAKVYRRVSDRSANSSRTKPAGMTAQRQTPVGI